MNKFATYVLTFLLGVAAGLAWHPTITVNLQIQQPAAEDDDPEETLVPTAGEIRA
jgi:hypothetical protein